MIHVQWFLICGNRLLGASQPFGSWGIFSREAVMRGLEIQTMSVVLHGVAGRYGSCGVPGNCVEKLFQQAAE
jgi:hypothetical protein